MGFSTLRHLDNLLGCEIWFSNRGVRAPNAPIRAVEYEHAMRLQAFVRTLNINTIAADWGPIREEPAGTIVEAVETFTHLDILEIRRPRADPIIKRDKSAGITCFQRPV